MAEDPTATTMRFCPRCMLARPQGIVLEMVGVVLFGAVVGSISHIIVSTAGRDPPTPPTARRIAAPPRHHVESTLLWPFDERQPLHGVLVYVGERLEGRAGLPRDHGAAAHLLHHQRLALHHAPQGELAQRLPCSPHACTPTIACSRGPRAPGSERHSREYHCRSATRDGSPTREISGRHD